MATFQKGQTMEYANLTLAEAEFTAYDFGSEFGVSRTGTPGAWTCSGREMRRDVVLSFGPDPYETAACTFSVSFFEDGSISLTEARLNGKLIGRRGCNLKAA
jgi:hypothetical protein